MPIDGRAIVPAVSRSHGISTELTTHNMNSPSTSALGLVIKNDGQTIIDTNFWDSDHAQRGMLYLSENAGTLRLLVPEAMEIHLSEMRTGRSAEIVDSLRFPGRCYDIVFDDGTSSPFFLAIDRRSVDADLRNRQVDLDVVTRNGVELELRCAIKVQRDQEADTVSHRVPQSSELRPMPILDLIDLAARYRCVSVVDKLLPTKAKRTA